MNLLKIFYLLILFKISIPIPNELTSFSDIELPKGISEYYYQYSNYFNDNDSNTPNIFIKLSDYEKIELKIFIDEIEEYYYNTKKEEWIIIPIPKEKKKNITLKVNAQEKNLRMIFFDSSFNANVNLAQFLSLDFSKNKSPKKLPHLYFNITVDRNIYLSLKQEEEQNNLNYAIIDGNKISYLQSKDVLLNPGKKYILFIKALQKDNYYFYQKIKIDKYIEKINPVYNNTFKYNNLAENNYLLIDIHKYSNIYFYINDNSGFYHEYYNMTTLSEKDFDNFFKNNTPVTADKIRKITNGKINNVEKITKNDYYLIIKLSNKTKKCEGYITFYSEMHKIQEEDCIININERKKAIMNISKSYTSIGIIVSSNNNIKLFKSQDEFTDRIILNNVEESIIYVDSSQNKTILTCNFYNDTSNEFYQNKVLMDNDINSKLNKMNNTNFFIRKITNYDIPKLYSLHFHGLKDVYYIYTKKYFGKTNLYRNELTDYYTPIKNILKPISYYEDQKYKIINNQLLKLTYYQSFNFFINSGTLFEFYIQKENDTDYIEINMDTNKYSRNLVKLLKDKYYYVKFELNHLIKLDNGFLDSSVYFFKNSSIINILDKEKKTVYIKGNDYVVEPFKTALIYIYEKIENFNDKSVIEFDKTQAGKNMKFKIVNKNKFEIKIAIAKDFGFREYYPMLNFDSMEMITIAPENNIDLFIENYYDILETDIYESDGEKYFVYLFQVIDNNKIILLNDDNVEIGEPIYFDAITTINNKLYFNIIPKGNQNLILKSPQKYNYINYQFIKCSSNDFIKFTVNFSNFTQNEEHNFDTNTMINKKIPESKRNLTLIHHFESKNEFLFSYDFSNKNPNDYYDFHRNENYGIKYLNLNSKTEIKNIFTIGFSPMYTYYSEYIIIIARKTKINNLYSFSNPCYLTHLLINNSKDICYKKVYYENTSFILEEIDVRKIKQDENDEYIINIISNNLFQFSRLEIYTPVLYSEKIKYSNAKKLKIFDNNYLMIEEDYFIYEHNSDETLYLSTSIIKTYFYDVLLILTENNENIKTFYHYNGDLYNINITKKGKYYFEFFYLGEAKNQEQIFRCYLYNTIIEEIDFTKNNYFGFYPILVSNDKNNKEYLSYYKISNLKEDKKVYFIYGNYLYDDHLFSSDIDNINFSFWICNLKNNNCTENQTSYKFLKGVDYKIYIHLFENTYKNRDYYFQWSYSFLPFYENNIQVISEGGYFSIDSPKIIKIEENKKFNFDAFNAMPFFISSDDKIINKGEDVPKIQQGYYGGIQIYSFCLEKNDKYRTIIFVPEKRDKLSQIFITNKKIELTGDTKIKKHENYLISLDKDYSINNYFETFSSHEENLRFVNTEKNDNNKNKNFIFDHQGKKYIYIDKINRNLNITSNTYQPKYLLFTILNDDTLGHFNFIPTNCRLNTDKVLINDLMNIYIDEFDTKYNLYIKKYYGPIQYYESEYKLKDIKNNIDTLTKPINNLKNKKSIFNRLIQLTKNQLITGYLSKNSLLDIYFEKDDDNKDIYLSNFKNRKYLKKNIEYQIHFYLNHLIKLEPQFNAEVIMYNQDIKIILNNKNQTGIVIGNDYKIKTNENVMIYFYPKTKKFQKRILPKKNEIVEILNNKCNFNYAIDFGFEGYEPPNMYYYLGNKIYFENLYEKLDINLTEGEYLYIYYTAKREDCIKINYIQDGIISSASKYNLFHIRKNDAHKFILANDIYKSVKFQIIQYPTKETSSYGLKVKYRDEIQEYLKDNIEFYINSGNNYDDYIDNLLFETENDLIISYSFYDRKDELMSYSSKWTKGIEQIKNLCINDIKLISDNFIKINFNPNFKGCLIKYIIIISPEETNKTNNDSNNDLYLIDLINNKEADFVAEEYYDIGENDFIEVNIDINKLIKKYKKLMVNIISQKLRFKKSLKFYEPKLFDVENYYNKKIKKYILLILGSVLFLALVYAFCKRKVHRKRNIKKERLKKFEIDLGTELNDSKDFIDNKI